MKMEAVMEAIKNYRMERKGKWDRENLRLKFKRERKKIYGKVPSKKKETPINFP